MRKYRLSKTPSRAQWIREGEWRSEVLTITAAGGARLTDRNGGWGGAYDASSFAPDKPKLLDLEEAAAILESWGLDDEDLERVRALAPQAAAFLP